MTTAAKILGYLGLKPADNLGVEEENTILTVSIEKFTNPSSEYLGGADALRQIEVRQWLSFAKKSRDSFSRNDTSSKRDSMMKALDETLRSKSYIVGTNITLADAVVYHLLGDFVDVINLPTYLHVQRWFDHVQHIFRKNDRTIRLISIPKKVSLISLINTPSTAEDSNRNTSTATSSATPGTTQAIQKAPPAAATATAAVPAAVAASDESGKVKKEKQKAEKPASSAPAQAPASSKAVKPVAPAETSAADPSSESSKQDPSKLDIRCGKVVKCWNHPESDKLLCEEIDVNDGPGVVRTIASGIRSAYSAEQLEGRMVLVLCNLKERAIAGFKSQVTDSHRHHLHSIAVS